MTQPDLPALSSDPDTLFFVPGHDPGLWTLEPPGPLWRTVPGGRITSACISGARRIRSRWERELDEIARHRRFAAPVEFASVPVIAENLTVAGGHLGVGGKWLLSGPAGERAAGAAFRAGRDTLGADAWKARFADHFRKAAGLYRAPPAWPGDAGGLDFVVEARNLANYFHFTKETLCTLALLDQVPGFDGRVKIVTEGPDAPGFVHRHLAALFPSLAGRVDILRGPCHFDRALTIWHADFAYFQAGAPDRDGLIGPDHALAGRDFTAGMMKSVQGNGHTTALRLLRERARRAAAEMPLDHLPRRFWLGRRPTPGHDRHIAAEPDIVDALARRGFSVLHFEDLPPLEQVGVMGRAEMMVSAHGAGVTNMMHAGSRTRVIELGTLQSGLHRWRDFTGLAHVSGAHYDLLVADFAHDGPEVIPPMRGHGLYPARLEPDGLAAFTDRIDALLDTAAPADV